MKVYLFFIIVPVHIETFANQKSSNMDMLIQNSAQRYCLNGIKKVDLQYITALQFTLIQLDCCLEPVQGLQFHTNTSGYTNLLDFSLFFGSLFLFPCFCVHFPQLQPQGHPILLLQFYCSSDIRRYDLCSRPLFVVVFDILSEATMAARRMLLKKQLLLRN